MYWCEECRKPLKTPLMAAEYEIHNEIDDGKYEKFEIPYCPICKQEVYETKGCSCGKWMNYLDDWCPECIKIRDKSVIHCIAQIRMHTKLQLSAEDTRDLILSYFGEVT